jgi:5-methylcytosine-specific restriction endonuclease McrA
MPKPSGARRASLIKKLIYRDGFRCRLCQGLTFKGKSDMTVDHIIPVSCGGTWGLYNLRLAHRKCNEERGNCFRHDGYYEELIIRYE